MKINNTELIQIGKMIEDAESVLLFPHIHPDEDALGSCAALCHYIRARGRNAWILLEAPLPYQLKGVWGSLCTTDTDILGTADLGIAIDCADGSRFPSRREAFDLCKGNAAIDHHSTDQCSIDRYYIDTEAAATTEIIYELFRAMEWPFGDEIVEALYTGLVTDSGRFMHSNTTARTHRIAADLIELGVDVNKVSVRLFDSVDPKDLAVQADVISRMEIFAKGKAVISTVSNEDIRRCGAKMENAEGVIDAIRQIRNAEIAAVLKEDDRGIRVSMRAKTWGNVADIASKFGGGGHIKAAGCTIEADMQSAKDQICTAIEEALTDQSKEVSTDNEDDR